MSVALLPCQQTLRQAHQSNGADFLVPVKGNHPELEARVTACLPDRTPAVIPPRRPASDLPPVPCVTAASMDENNRSRHERRSLRWVAADAETLCCAHVRSVVEITRETIPLSGKNKGKTSVERIIYICSIEPDFARGSELLERIRR